MVESSGGAVRRLFRNRSASERYMSEEPPLWLVHLRGEKSVQIPYGPRDRVRIRRKIIGDATHQLRIVEAVWSLPQEANRHFPDSIPLRFFFLVHHCGFLSPFCLR